MMNLFQCVSVKSQEEIKFHAAEIFLRFFKKYPSPYELASADLDDVKELIKSCSFFNNKDRLP